MVGLTVGAADISTHQPHSKLVDGVMNGLAMDLVVGLDVGSTHGSVH